ncbi:MAG: imidazoleglycerol-phosphate dehydratase HisB [Armatimonadota bacterium]|jgi:imidazoleglycerol-phosphate dehydratase|nr:imidazoleglycerol-phosphate dehydratase HisB [Fimbriimonadaceae bacterium]MCZ8138534.1 imidazoleglycerol-phosphate dehydratase HisB [Fimbriimonadaceae bacterium]
MSKGSPHVRYAEVERETTETKVSVVLDLDGGQRRDVHTGIGFLDHMLQLMAFHGQFNLGVTADGDLEVDDHHTVEDVGITLGQAFRTALLEVTAIQRYGDLLSPMDDALVAVAVDISGRGMAFVDLPFRRENLGGLATENIAEFMRAFAMHSGMTIHVRRLAGDNDHHLCEAAFKGLGRALHAATRTSDRQGVASTKGKLLQS